VIGGALTLVGSAVAAQGDKEEKEVKQEKVEKIEKIEKELKELKEDPRARNDRDQVILNLNKGNLIRLLDIDDLLIEEPD
jgi:molybdopterin converting factor small subunit